MPDDLESWLEDRRKRDEEYITKTGRRLTEEDINELVAEAEAGYDVSDFTMRFKRVGNEIHIIDPVGQGFGVTGVAEPPRRRGQDHMTDREDVREQLGNLVAKIDNEGLDYFLLYYGGIDMVPEIVVLTTPDRTLRDLARDAANALKKFDTALEALCEHHDVEYIE